MSDDKKLSELITKSIRRELSPQESTILENHIQGSEEARKFADLSQRIQDSMTGFSVAETAGTDEDLTVLSDEFQNPAERIDFRSDRRKGEHVQGRSDRKT